MLMTALQTKAKKLPEKPAVEQKGFKAFLKKNIYIIIAFRSYDHRLCDNGGFSIWRQANSCY